MNHSPILESLIENPVFDHIKVTGCTSRLQIQFSRFSPLKQTTIKKILLLGALPITVAIVAGVVLASCGFKEGTLVALIGTSLLFLLLSLTASTLFFGYICQLPDVVELDSEQFVWRTPTQRIEIPWSEIVEISQPPNQEIEQSIGPSGLLLTTTNGTFQALPVRSAKSCDYVANLIVAFAEVQNLNVKYVQAPTTAKIEHFPLRLRDRKKHRYSLPFILVVFAGFSTWFAASEYIDYQRQQNWIVYQAKITDVEIGISNRSTTKNATYSYEVNDEKITGSYYWSNIPAYSHIIEPVKGAIVEIRYNPDRHRQSKISRETVWSTVVLGVLGSAVFVLLAMYFWRTSHAPIHEAEKYSVDPRQKLYRPDDVNVN